MNSSANFQQQYDIRSNKSINPSPSPPNRSFQCSTVNISPPTPNAKYGSSTPHPKYSPSSSAADAAATPAPKLWSKPSLPRVETAAPVDIAVEDDFDDDFQPGVE